MKKLLIILSIIMTLSLVGCGNKLNSSATGNTGDAPSLDMGSDKNQIFPEIKEDAIINPDSTVNTQDKKIINKADLVIETLEFDKSLTTVEELVKNFKGYIESSNISQVGIKSSNYGKNRSASFVVRVPKDKFQEFLKETTNLGLITSQLTHGDDISSTYYDSETRVKVLKAQEDKYLSLLTQAKDIKEILEIERELTEIRYEIEKFQGSLKQMDNLVDYSTINIRLQEVIETTNIESPAVTLGEKIVKAFNDSLKSLKFFGTAIILILVASFPYLIILSILGYLGYIISKKVRINKK
ncbi:MAG: DUF4349 domain-containing protein [Clostridium sp.]|uniref:DUF4349 domain-containing protein n=1 Tax=Clostridium sp. TaxID=1506 RepID=UPI00302312B6